MCRAHLSPQHPTPLPSEGSELHAMVLQGGRQTWAQLLSRARAQGAYSHCCKGAGVLRLGVPSPLSSPLHKGTGGSARPLPTQRLPPAEPPPLLLSSSSSPGVWVFSASCSLRGGSGTENAAKFTRLQVLAPANPTSPRYHHWLSFFPPKATRLVYSGAHVRTTTRNKGLGKLYLLTPFVSAKI